MADFEQDPTTRLSARARGLQLPSVELVVVAGPDRGQKAAIRRGLARVGTAEGSDLRLTDRAVSRVHCELRVDRDGVIVRDAGSTNGTFVEGVRLAEGVVRAGTLLAIGGSIVRVDVADEPSFVELSNADAFGELIGASVAMRRAYSVLERVAATDATVLVTGETGTGKDVAARSLHAASSRAAGPFVAVDCGAIPETLFESELFGHQKGAFSGATHDRRGVLEEAHRGTLFLDEIGEVPLALQSKLLRALESRSVRRLGTAIERPIDTRIVAATNRPLAEAVNQGVFREDLYYRLAVVEVVMPPLRSRREDIGALARHFWSRLGGKGELPAELVATLERRSWPGNVRELRNFVERSVSLGLVSATSAPPAPPIRGVEDLVPIDRPLKEARQAWMESFDTLYLKRLLEQTDGNVTRAAELAGVSRRFLQRMAARLGVRATDLADDE